jgi:hypothetical protein
LPANSNTKQIKRVIDANTNRAKEGLRVCEEITRFILDNKGLTTSFKKIRHEIDGLLKQYFPHQELLRNREALKDVGRKVYINELKRRNINDIFFANIQRVKESIRVLEEFSKLLNKKAALNFKLLRYRVYELEKSTAKEII